MPNDIQSFLIHFLNLEPFNLNLTPLQFDQLPPNQLLQITSNVLSWIFQTDQIDIRRENAEDTAIRILNLLRILRYRPQIDQDLMDEWRAGIVEGSKGSIYPLLVVLFENTEALKERAYLAKYLMKTEVPSEVHDYDTSELQNEIGELMNEFKNIHADMKDIQADVLLLDDIKEDLKSMDKEKQLLIRKIEKSEKKVQNIPFFDRHMQLASQLRGERDSLAEYTLQKHQERQKVINAESRINRLTATLAELRNASKTIDQTSLVGKVEDEVATNTYLVNEKLAEDIEIRKAKIKELSGMVRAYNIKEDDLNKMNEQIENLSKNIKELQIERDSSEVDVDENMSIFRHQVTALERKKEIAVQRLQNIRQELAKIENEVEDRKNILQAQVGGEVLSTVKYKKHLDNFRSRNEEHRRKRRELNELQSEKTLYKRTTEILAARYAELKNHIENIGGELVEVLHVPTQFDRPKTAAPATNNVDDIRKDLKNMISSIDQKKDDITDKRTKRENLKSSVKDSSDNLESVRQATNAKNEDMQLNNMRMLESINTMEEKFKHYSKAIPELKDSFHPLSEVLNSLQGYENDDGLQKLEDNFKEETSKEKELDDQLAEIGDIGALREQAEMWKTLQVIFETKIDIYKEKLASK